MARVSVRIGWGKSSRTLSGVALINLALGLLLQREGYFGLGILLGAFATLSLFFALVHPHRVLELDDDDPPDRKVGDIIDD
jgi:hypothetical protein